jgi:hypothetical protein
MLLLEGTIHDDAGICGVAQTIANRSVDCDLHSPHQDAEISFSTIPFYYAQQVYFGNIPNSS